MTRHPFHKTIGRLMDNGLIKETRLEILHDEACGKEGKRISLYNQATGNQFRYCNVDILIVINKKPKIIVEIEESYVTPGRVFGKFFASTLSDCYQVKGMAKPCRLAGSVLFIQVLDSSKLKEASKTQGQWEHIENQVRVFLRKKPLGKITQYEIVQGNKKAFHAGGNGAKKLKKIIRAFLK